ncbi:hypothetical protein ACP4OV_028731 [Aristida adscensionis]
MRPAAMLAICALPALLLLLLLPARGSKPFSAAVAAVDVAAASKLLGLGGYRYLDVRTEEEYRKGHVENSLNVPYVFFTSQGKEKNPQFIEQVAAQFDKQDDIVVGCKSGVRSELACADLIAAGFRNVKNMEGGYDAWVQNGIAVKKPQAQDEL